MIKKNDFNKKRTTNIILMIVIAAILGAIFLLSNTDAGDDAKYHQIVGYFDDGEVKDYTLDLGSGELTVYLDGAAEAIEYTVPDVGVFLDDVSDTVKQYNELHPEDKITYDYIPVPEPNIFLSFLPYIFLFGMIALFYFFMMRRAEGGGKQAMSFGKAKVKPDDNSNKVNFGDVAGVEEEKEELEEIVDFLKDPKKFNDIGARIPKGVLLVGPPGTGKTLLARAVSGEAGVPFFSISGSNFVEMFVGVGASRVRDLFAQAKKAAPSIIFIDEIDAVGRKRGAGLGGGNDEREQTLNQLLVEMDGFDNNVGVIIIAATNRVDVLDPALLRPGRFDRQVFINYPDVKGREAILKIHGRKKPFAPDVDLAVIAKATVGFTGADLENVLNEAALLTARRNRKSITMEDINEATVKVLVGPEKKSKVIKEEERKLTAYHEAGHAIATYACDTQSTVHQISIIPRGMAGGYTMSLPDMDKSYKRKGEMIESIIVLLAGRVAEQQVLDDISTGASNDLQRATQIAKSMVTRYGFSERLGAVVYGGNSDEIFVGRDLVQSRDYSESAASEIDKEVRNIIEDAYKKTEDILENYQDKLHIIAKALLEFEKIEGAQFVKLMEDEIKEISEGDDVKSDAAVEKTKDSSAE